MAPGAGPEKARNGPQKVKEGPVWPGTAEENGYTALPTGREQPDHDAMGELRGTVRG
jgi:hypothetical protein